MATESVSLTRTARNDRVPPHSEEAERGVLGSSLLEAEKVLDLCLERQLSPESFYVPSHRVIFSVLIDLAGRGEAVDVLTVTERLKAVGQLEQAGGALYLDRLIDSTPTPAHAEYYIDVVRQQHLLRCIIECAREAEHECHTSPSPADEILSSVEQAFLNITERQHGAMTPWADAVNRTMEHVERVLSTHRGLNGLSTGFLNLDGVLHGLRPDEMIVVAARPGMGKTSLAMNIAEHVALGHRDPDRQARPVAIFSLEMSSESLVLRMLCSHGGVEGAQLMTGRLPTASTHQKLTAAASLLRKAPIYLDDTGGLDVMELRARARRMRKKFDVELIVIDYLQLLQSRDYARQGRQLETAAISGHLKSMAKELHVPVLVLSQLSRAPEQRDKQARPKLSDLRDSGAIEQDADVVCLLRRPSKYAEADEDDAKDPTLAIVDVAKQRNGPTGEVELNFDERYTRFRDRKTGVDEPDGAGPARPAEGGDGMEP